MVVRDEDFQAFSEFEKNTWARLTEHYVSLSGRITQQASTVALDAIGVGSGMMLLDVACGPGYVAAEATKRGAKSIGIDFSADMVDVAREQFPDIRFEVGDAQQLAFTDKSFDSIICSFGLLHLPRPGLALREASRVLRSGGRYAFTVWSIPQQTDFFGIIGQVIQTYSEPTQTTSNLPGMFMLSDPWVSSALMDSAGFQDVTIAQIPIYFEPTSTADVIEFLYKSTMRPAEAFKQMAPGRRSEAENALRDGAKKAMASGGGRIACPALLVTGASP